MDRKLRLSIKGVVRFLILYLLLGGMWWFFRSYLLFLAMVLIPCCVILSGTALWVCRNRLRAEAVIPAGRVGKNTNFAFDICVHNEGRFVGFTADVHYCFRNVFTGYSEEKKAHLWVAPMKGCEVHQQLSSRYAGRVEAEVSRFVVYDLFHIFALHGCETTATAALVWPTFSESEDEAVCSCVEGFPQENESRKRGAEYNPDYEVREYIPGDELKSIHWKLTAKQDRLMVRERLATGRDKMNVLLPLTGNREENDGLLEALYGLCRLLLEKEYPVQLYWPGKGMLQGCFVAEFGELENAISRILSGAASEGNATELMAMEHPGEKYIMIQTGAYKGAYIQ